MSHDDQLCSERWTCLESLRENASLECARIKTSVLSYTRTFGNKVHTRSCVKAGFPKLLVDWYPLDTVAGLHVSPKCCDVSLKQGGPTSSLLRATFRNCSSWWASAG